MPRTKYAGNIGNTMPITRELAKCFRSFKLARSVYAIEDIFGEDHIYAIGKDSKPMFDMLVSNSRRFVFVWYYLHPSKGLQYALQLKEIALRNHKDFVIKYPNIPIKKAGWPSIIRYGKKLAGENLEKFILKGGNPQLEAKIYSDEALKTYRNYNWHKVPNALGLIKDKAMEMESFFLTKRGRLNKSSNIRGRVLYAGCAYHYSFPHLGFGMRDIDVETFFSPEWFVNTRCALTQPCDIKEFGEPTYFANKTRWLDLMWNSFHSETKNFAKDVIVYMNEMRHKSDRWATISQRPMIDLGTEQTIYIPNWIKRIRIILSKRK